MAGRKETGAVRKMSRAGVIFAGGLLVLAVGGCQVLYFLGGKGDQAALYKFGKDQKVLVLVDVREGVTPPPTFATSLADQIGAHLVRYKATDNLVSEARVVDLEEQNPDKFKGMGIADIARKTGADVVLDVYLTQLDVPLSSDKTVAEGMAEAYVKVVDKSGNRLYPGEETGTHITAHVDAGFLSDRDVSTIQKQMMDQLTTLTGRMFHSYDMEDKDMIESAEDRKVIGQ